MNIKDLLKDAYKEGMTLEDVEKALESIELPADGSAEIDRLKAALSKAIRKPQITRSSCVKR